MINATGNYNSYHLSLKKAAKAYRDEYYTGLTDDDKQAINSQMRVYLERHPLRSPQDRVALDNYFQNLRQKYGFKGNIDFEYLFDKALGDENGYDSVYEKPRTDEDDAPDYDVYAKFVEGMPKTTSKIATEYDGTRYMVTETQKGTIMKIKINDAITVLNQNESGSGRINVNGLANAYERIMIQGGYI